MKNILLLLTIVILSSCTTENPKQNWLKGNLHTHSFWSDGDDFPEMIIQWYKNNNYQFIALSDHNTIAEGEKWYFMGEREKKNNTLAKYQAAFGDWVTTKTIDDSTWVRLKTYDEYRDKLEVTDQFLVIKSEEITSSFERKPVHINATNLQYYIPPVKGASVVDVMQQTIDAVKKQREESNIPMFAHINHPNFGFAITAEDFKQLNGEQFFEVYNGHPAVFNGGNDLHMSTEEMWDIINISYYEQGKPLLYGIATDDSHNYHQQSTKHSNTGRGWVMVDAHENERSAIIHAMETGSFYASSGIELKSVIADKKSYKVEIVAEDGVQYKITFLGLKKGSSEVVELFQTSETSATYKFDADDIFVRVKISSDKIKVNPYREGETLQAWTQPILIK